MNERYGRDLDLNLLRVFFVVAETGSVTEAASRLYLSQPAVSAALKRLHEAVGEPLFTREGRGLTLTKRGERLTHSGRPHLEALLDATLSPESFDPARSERTIRLGLADSMETWLLPRLMRALESEAPNIKLIVISVQFRTIREQLLSRKVDLAVTVADELAPSIRREVLSMGRFCVLYDGRRHQFGEAISLESYLAQAHVIVSYNGDLAGVVEDIFGHRRRVRLSLSTFHSIGAVIEGSSLLATVPETVAIETRRLRPTLEITRAPFEAGETPIELLWRSALDDDEAIAYLREKVRECSTA